MSEVALADLVDVSTFRPDGTIGMTGAVIRGARVVVEHVARAWFTTPGTLRHAEHVGFGLERLRNGTATKADIQRYRAWLTAEARAVDFVRDCVVALTTEPVGTGLYRVKIGGRLTLTDGTVYPLAVTLDEAATVVSLGGVV